MKSIKSVALYSVLIAGFGVLSSCDHGHHGEEHGKFHVAKPWRQKIEHDKEYVAQIQGHQHIEIRSFERGFLEEILIDEGKEVQQGEELFKVRPLLIQAEYEKVKAEYDIVKIEYGNTQRLYKQKVVSKNEFALSKAKLEKATAELALAKSHLDFMTIKAPFNGIVDRFEVRLGSLLEEGELLTTISDISKMWVYFNVSETDYLDYMERKEKENTLVRLRLANDKFFKHNGKIDTIEADFNNETGNVAFRASFENPDKLLRHGQTGNIVLTETIDNALVIPQRATFEVLDKKFVYIVDKDHIVHSKQIEIALETPSLFIVKSGITDQDDILVDGLGKVEVGKKIEFDLQDSKTVLASLELPVE